MGLHRSDITLNSGAEPTQALSAVDALFSLAVAMPVWCVCVYGVCTCSCDLSKVTKGTWESVKDGATQGFVCVSRDLSAGLPEGE